MGCRDVLIGPYEQSIGGIGGERTFLRCSLRRQQPSLGSRRFDNLCDPSSCVHLRRRGARWGPGATFTASGAAMVGASKGARWTKLVPGRLRGMGIGPTTPCSMALEDAQNRLPGHLTYSPKRPGSPKEKDGPEVGAELASR
jgi:hypothetical protein